MTINNIRVHLMYSLNLVALLLVYPLILVTSLIKSIFAFSMEDENISGQVAVITGGAQGLGRLLAIELAKKGCQIAVLDIQEDLAMATAKYINETFGVKAKSYKVDVSNYQQLVDFHAQVTNDFGDVTILMNNAGLIIFNKDYHRPEEVQQLITVNVTSIVWINQLFLPKMKALNRGHIVTISSLSALFPAPVFNIYSATKSAVRAYMAALRADLKIQNYDIKLTTIMPTFLNTHKPTVATLESIRGLTTQYPLADGVNVAEQVIANMLQGSEEIVLPGVCGIMHKVYELLPPWARDIMWKISNPESNLGDKKFS